MQVISGFVDMKYTAQDEHKECMFHVYKSMTGLTKLFHQTIGMHDIYIYLW